MNNESSKLFAVLKDLDSPLDYEHVLELILRTDLRIRDEHGNNPLHYFVSREQPDISLINTLIDHGADVNSSNCYGLTPLLAASGHCCPDIVSILIAAGADVDFFDSSIPKSFYDKDGFTPLLKAARWNKNPRVLSILIQAGANVNHRIPMPDWWHDEPDDQEVPMFCDSFPLWVAVCSSTSDENRRDAEKTQILIDSGADVNAVSVNKNRTVLAHAAQFCSDPAVVDILLDSGANPKLDLPSRRGESSFWRAVRINNRSNKNDVNDVLYYARRNKHLVGTETFIRLSNALN